MHPLKERALDTLIDCVLDCAYELVGSRLRDVLSGFSNLHDHHSTENENNPNLDNVHHFATPTLPLLLSLVTHQSASFPPIGTFMLIIDSISTLFALAFPKTAQTLEHQETPVKKSDSAKWASGRRWAVMGDLISKLGRLAATRNIAIILISQTTTKVRYETGAVLYPAIAGNAWDAGIGTRIVLFRDWIFQMADMPSSQGDLKPGTRFAGIAKAKGVSYDGVGHAVAFSIKTVSSGSISCHRC